MLLYIMLHIVLAYLMLFAALSNAVCLYNESFFLPLISANICRFLTSTATATLVSAFVLSRIDYSDSLLFGSTHDVTSQMQRIQNYAARVILRLP